MTYDKNLYIRMSPGFAQKPPFVSCEATLNLKNAITLALWLGDRYVDLPTITNTVSDLAIALSAMAFQLASCTATLSEYSMISNG